MTRLTLGPAHHRGRTMAALLFLGPLLLVLAGCQLRPAEAPRPAHDALVAMRTGGATSNDPEVVGRWLLSELVASDGSAEEANRAAKRLRGLEHPGVAGSLALAIDDDVHGRLALAAGHYWALLERAADAEASTGVETGDGLANSSAMFAWYAARRLGELKHAWLKPGNNHHRRIEKLLQNPGPIGWRARGELVELWGQLLRRQDAAAGPGPGAGAATALARITAAQGCLDHARFAGPFGTGRSADHRVAFSAERSAPWPYRFDPGPADTRVPRRLEAKVMGCRLVAKTDGKGGGRGIYYVQTMFDLEQATDAIVAVQGAYRISIDDHVVLDRDLAEWGVWPRFGVRVTLAPGRHRLVARLVAAETSVRFLSPDGLPIPVTSFADDSAPYRLLAPQIGPSPNVLEPFLQQLGIATGPSSGPQALRRNKRGVLDAPAMRFVAAYLAHIEGQDDLASVLLEPLVKDIDAATGVTLSFQADYVDGDPIFPGQVARDLARDLRKRATDRDEHLWRSELWLALEQANKLEPSDVVSSLEGLAVRFPRVPIIQKKLAGAYQQLGWQVEHHRTLTRASKQFPHDLELLRQLHRSHLSRGETKTADLIVKRLQSLDPNDDTVFRLAIERGDYDGALVELKRLALANPGRDDLTARIKALSKRAGHGGTGNESLQALRDQNPRDPDRHLAVADSELAAGKQGALQRGLLSALRANAPEGKLRDAIELVDGVTDLEPLRRDGLEVIREAERSGRRLPGTAARILDYGVVWVSRDGRARMLEHEIIRVQDPIGIARHVEQQLPRGRILKLRTIKADGRVLEPEIVADKPTVTMPHLEVGDYIETESIWNLRGPTAKTERFQSPRWFFREENTSYHLSEYVLVTPREQAVVVEDTGDIPKPTVERRGTFTVRRWIVTASIAVPEEPMRAPTREFLPSVRVGWGINLDTTLDLLTRAASDVPPIDPRMRRIAETIVSAKLAGATGENDAGPKTKKGPDALTIDDKAKRIYRWVLDTIEPGGERAGPRIVTSKSGDRTQAFLYLCRAAGIDARLGVVRDRLKPPPKGPFSAAETYTVPVVRVALEGGKTRWLIVQERYAPYGFLPSALRGQPAVPLEAKAPLRTEAIPAAKPETTSDEGAGNEIFHQATIQLAADGSAKLDLTQIYRGRYAIQLRTALSKVPDGRQRDVVQSKLLGRSLPGVVLKDLALPNIGVLDEPVRLEGKLRVPNFARLGSGEMVLSPPFLGNVSALAALPTRQTPLYISEGFATQTRIKFRVKLPPGAKVLTTLRNLEVRHPSIQVTVKDRLRKDGLIIERHINLPAGRVQPDDYAAFRQEVLRANSALNQPIRIKLP